MSVHTAYIATEYTGPLTVRLQPYTIPNTNISMQIFLNVLLTFPKVTQGEFG